MVTADTQLRETVRDFAARAVIVLLYVPMSVNLLGDFLSTRHLTAILLLVSELLVVVFTIARRRAQLIDRSLGARLASFVAVVGPPLVRAVDNGALLPDVVTAAMVIAGTSIVVAGKLSLGRSFGIVPANRGIVARGPYLIVRHPIYAGYFVMHAAFLLAHPSPWNIAALAAADAALVVRALMEEKVLLHDTQYQAYCSRVNWRLVPGVF